MNQFAELKSMLPLIMPEDKVIVEKSSLYKIDDIAIFERDKRLIAHRIIYKDPEDSFLVTKGDNNLESDGKIKKEQILGKVEEVKRNDQTITLSHLYLIQSSTYLAELKRVSEKFAKEKIEFITLKGLPVHIHVSGAPPKRLYLDADILIRKRNFDQASKVLQRLGFSFLKSTLLGKKVKQTTQITFVKKTKPLTTAIDLHFEPAIGFTKVKELNQLLPKIEPFTRFLYTNSKMISIDKARFPILKNDALVFYLLLHFFHHNLQGAYRLNLIHELSKNKKVNWGKVAREAENYGLTNFVYPPLLILEKYYPSSISKKDLDKFRPKVFKVFFAKIALLFVSPFNESGRSTEAIKRLALLFLFSDVFFSKRIKIVLGKRVRNYYFPTIKSLLFRI